MISLSVCNRTHQNSAPSSDPPEPPPICRSFRKVTASIRVIFMGSVLSTAACVAAGNVVPPIIGRQPMPVRFRKDLLLSFMVVLLQHRQRATEACHRFEWRRKRPSEVELER